MFTIFILGILVGLVNLQISLAIGLKSNRLCIAITAFAFFEMTMPLLGLLIGNKINSSFQNIAEWLGPIVMLALGVYVIANELMEGEKKDVINNKWMLISLPFLMSLDNLVSGIGLGTVCCPVLSASVIVGFCTGFMCFFGLFLGEKVRNRILKNIEFVSVIYMVIVAVFWITK